MHLGRLLLPGIALLYFGGAYGSALPATGQCEMVRDGVEYRAFLPDGRRFVYISVKMLPGAMPAVFLVVDKNYLGKPAQGDPILAWWLDRKQPMRFSSDKLKISWKDEGSFHFITGLFSSDDTVAISDTIPGLARQGDHFEGAGNDDNNVFAFQLSFEMPGFRGDDFDVSVPAVSYDGVTLAPPPIHFTLGDDGPQAKC